MKDKHKNKTVTRQKFGGNIRYIIKQTTEKANRFLRFLKDYTSKKKHKTDDWDDWDNWNPDHPLYI